MERIDVLKEMGVVEHIFIKKKDPDAVASAERLAATEKFFEEWHAAINRTNTREMPTELLAEYEKAAIALCKILTMEKAILKRD